MYRLRRTAPRAPPRHHHHHRTQRHPSSHPSPAQIERLLREVDLAGGQAAGVAAVFADSVAAPVAATLPAGANGSADRKSAASVRHARLSQHPIRPKLGLGLTLALTANPNPNPNPIDTISSLIRALVPMMNSWSSRRARRSRPWRPGSCRLRGRRRMRRGGRARRRRRRRRQS